ncbi:MAG TPA: hypothetical protein VD835_09800 [Pyrinomonadaceae bacterium]|nr:hypothetical protein [Pyrinomonadaceae bacterium]
MSELKQSQQKAARLTGHLAVAAEAIKRISLKRRGSNLDERQY